MAASDTVSTSALPPVTVLCGFLGAGKTTLLNHLLRQAEGRRWAAVVNDVAAINIDAAVVRTQSGGRDLVELGNGCVCCSSRDDLAEAIAQLAGAGVYDHILVETSGVAEPRGVANLFLRKNPFGRSLSDFARLSALVSVVDAAHFLAEQRRQTDRTELAPGASRPVFELMVEQVECADVIVINKCDLLAEEELAALEAVIQSLNDRAEIVRAEHGQVASEFLLGRPRFDAAATMGASRWVKVLDALGRGERNPAQPFSFVAKPGGKPLATKVTPSHEERFGIKTMVFQARRPFAQEKFLALLARGIPGLLRAKGFFWLAERPDEMGFLSAAGRTMRHDFPSYWWAGLIERGRARRDQLPAALEKIWVEPQGDRRQELVFIGVGLDEKTLRQNLEQCLVEG